MGETNRQAQPSEELGAIRIWAARAAVPTGRTSDLVLKTEGAGKGFYGKQLLSKSELKAEVSQAFRPQALRTSQQEKRAVDGLELSQTTVLGHTDGSGRLELRSCRDWSPGRPQY